jgi:branched-chain amino acid transport system permease protein
VLLERTMMRRLTDAPVAIALVVTVGLLAACIGLAQSIWKPGGRDVPEFFVGQAVDVGPVRVTVHQLIILGTAVAVAGGLYVLLNRTRIGTAMRAVVDNRELLALHGARPNLLSALSWAIGCALAALAGILIAPQLSLSYIDLTLLVISAYAAAMVGRLRNLPRTFVGAVVLGLMSSYALWGVSKISKETLDASQGLIQGARIALPTLFLLAVMLVLPQEKLRVGRITGTTLPPLPTWRRTLAWAAVFLTVVYAMSSNISRANNSQFGQALCLSLIMLSLVLLTGYGGDVSLCQLSFVGVGALVTGNIVHGVSPLSLVLAFLISGAVGVLIAVPALRLRGLYLGLGTLAIASAMDTLVFETRIFGFGARGAYFEIARPSWLRSEQSFVMAVAVAFVVMAMVVLAIRRGKYGRILLATRDSQAACATLGFSTTAVRVAVFGVSAGLAGVAGVFYTGMHVTVSTDDFFFFKSLPLLLFAAVAGLTCVSGALLGGLLYGALPFLTDKYPALATWVAGPGLLAGILLLGGNPNGLVGILFGLRNRWARQTAPPPSTAPAGAELSPVLPTRSRAEEGVVVGSA